MQLKKLIGKGAPQVELIDGEKLVEMFKRVELGAKSKLVCEVDLPFIELFIGKK